MDYLAKATNPKLSYDANAVEQTYVSSIIFLSSYLFICRIVKGLHVQDVFVISISSLYIMIQYHIMVLSPLSL
jgi:hypothetical protein